MKLLRCETSVVTLKTDNEPALVGVVGDVAKVWAGRGASGLSWIILHILSKSNGVIEWGNPDDRGNGEDAQECHRREVDGEARPRERAVDVAG